MIRQILGAVAQYERALIKLRLAAGRERKRAAGGYAGGRPAYGQVAVEGELQRDNIELEVIRYIHRLRDDGLTLKQIVDELTEMEEPAPGGERWYRTTVRRLLDR